MQRSVQTQRTQAGAAVNGRHHVAYKRITLRGSVLYLQSKNMIHTAAAGIYIVVRCSSTPCTSRSELNEDHLSMCV